MNLKLIGILLCTLALGGAVWFFTGQKNNQQSVSTHPQPTPLFSQGLKIDSEISKTEIQQKTQAPDVLPLPSATSGGKGPNPLSNQEIEETLLKYQRQFQNCWTQRLRTNPQLSGRILIHMTIGTSGKISNVEVPQTDIQDATMIQCLKSVIQRIPFRQFSGNPITLSLPLDFTS